LIALSVKTLPKPLRPRGAYFWILISLAVMAVALGLYGGVCGAYEHFS
jgi:hypothetical protein